MKTGIQKTRNNRNNTGLKEYQKNGKKLFLF